MHIKRAMKGGFSLSEVLIAVALIAVLAALVLPVYSMMRERSASAQCLANMRVYGSAVLAYAAEHNGLPYWSGTADRSDGSVALQYYKWLRLARYFPDGDVARPLRSQLHCPIANSKELINPYGFHYAGNGNLNTYFPKMRGIPAPASRVILAAECYDQDGFWAASHMNTTMRGSPGATPPRRGQFHSVKGEPGLHCFFLDGHIELIAPAGGDWGNAPTFGNATNGGYFYAASHFSRLKDGTLIVR